MASKSRIWTFLGKVIFYLQKLHSLFRNSYAVVSIWIEGLRLELNQSSSLQRDQAQGCSVLSLLSGRVIPDLATMASVTSQQKLFFITHRAKNR